MRLARRAPAGGVAGAGQGSSRHGVPVPVLPPALPAAQSAWGSHAGLPSALTPASAAAMRPVCSRGSRRAWSSGVQGSGRLRSLPVTHATNGDAAAAAAAPAEAGQEGPGSDQEATCVRAVVPCVPGDAAELLSDALLGMGAQSVVIQEHRPPGAPEQEIFHEPGSDEAPQLWDMCDVVAHFPLEHEDVEGTLVEAAEICEVEVDAAGLRVIPVPNEQWVEQIKASYVPLKLSQRMHIVPEWSSPPEGQDPGAINIILQPGVAFGTGEHPTTRMCLAALEEAEAKLRGTRVMDYGCGSGVLALAALKLGAASAVGTDTDPLAVRSTAHNARLNGYADAMTALQCGPSLDDPEPVADAGQPAQGAFDVVCANILRGPLLELAPRLAAYCKPGGMLLLSGILQEQVPDIREAYKPFFGAMQVRTEGTWACITAERHS